MNQYTSMRKAKMITGKNEEEKSFLFYEDDLLEVLELPCLADDDLQTVANTFACNLEDYKSNIDIDGIPVIDVFERSNFNDSYYDMLEDLKERFF